MCHLPSHIEHGLLVEGVSHITTSFKEPSPPRDPALRCPHDHGGRRRRRNRAAAPNAELLRRHRMKSYRVDCDQIRCRLTGHRAATPSPQPATTIPPQAAAILALYVLQPEEPSRNRIDTAARLAPAALTVAIAWPPESNHPNSEWDDIYM